MCLRRNYWIKHCQQLRIKNNTSAWTMTTNDGNAAIAKQDYVPHILPIDEVATAPKHKKSKPRRWMMQRTFGWLPQCRALHIRYDMVRIGASMTVGFIVMTSVSRVP